MKGNKMEAPNFSGFMRALVLRNDDEELNGSILVWIPRLMPKFDHPETEVFKVETINSSLWESGGGGQQVGSSAETSNGMWARPCFMESNNDGTYKIPRIQSWIYVFFEEENPKKCRWLPLSPFVGNDVTKMVNAEDSDSTKVDYKKKKNIDATEYEDGTVVVYDYNPEVMSFLIKFSSGHKIKVIDNPDTSRIELVTKKGNLIIIDDILDDITVKSNATINILSADLVNVETTNVVVKASGDVKVTASGSCDVKAATASVTAGTIALKGKISMN
jgi:hypothetical protein